MNPVHSLLTPIRFVYDITTTNIPAILVNDVEKVVYDLSLGSADNTLVWKVSDGKGGFTDSTLMLPDVLGMAADLTGVNSRIDTNLASIGLLETLTVLHTTQIATNLSSVDALNTLTGEHTTQIATNTSSITTLGANIGTRIDDLPAPIPQVKSDWTESDEDSLAFIENKPENTLLITDDKGALRTNNILNRGLVFDTTDDKLYKGVYDFSEHTFEQDPSKNFILPSNRYYGLTTDGTTVWFISRFNLTAIAINKATLQRDPSKDLPIPSILYYTLTTDGTTIWTVRITGTLVIAINKATLQRDPSKDFHLPKTEYYGLTTDGTTIWAVNKLDTLVVAINKATLQRDPSKDFHLPKTEYYDLTTDGTTIWAVNRMDTLVIAINKATLQRDTSKDFHLPSTNYFGLTTDATTIWAVSPDSIVVTAYSITQGIILGNLDYTQITQDPPIPQVNSNWNEADTTSKAFIQNKPTIPVGLTHEQENAISDLHVIEEKVRPIVINMESNYVATTDLSMAIFDTIPTNAILTGASALYRTNLEVRRLRHSFVVVLSTIRDLHLYRVIFTDDSGEVYGTHANLQFKVSDGNNHYFVLGSASDSYARYRISGLTRITAQKQVESVVDHTWLGKLATERIIEGLDGADGLKALGIRPTNIFYGDHAQTVPKLNDWIVSTDKKLYRGVAGQSNSFVWEEYASFIHPTSGGSADTPAQLVLKLSGLQDDARLSANALKDLPAVNTNSLLTDREHILLDHLEFTHVDTSPTLEKTAVNPIGIPYDGIYNSLYRDPILPVIVNRFKDGAVLVNEPADNLKFIHTVDNQANLFSPELGVYVRSPITLKNKPDTILHHIARNEFDMILGFEFSITNHRVTSDVVRLGYSTDALIKYDQETGIYIQIRRGTSTRTSNFQNELLVLNDDISTPPIDADTGTQGENLTHVPDTIPVSNGTSTVIFNVGFYNNGNFEGRITNSYTKDFSVSHEQETFDFILNQGAVVNGVRVPPVTRSLRVQISYNATTRIITTRENLRHAGLSYHIRAYYITSETVTFGGDLAKYPINPGHGHDEEGIFNPELLLRHRTKVVLQLYKTTSSGDAIIGVKLSVGNEDGHRYFNINTRRVASEMFYSTARPMSGSGNSYADDNIVTIGSRSMAIKDINLISNLHNVTLNKNLIERLFNAPGEFLGLYRYNSHIIDTMNVRADNLTVNGRAVMLAPEEEPK